MRAVQGAGGFATVLHKGDPDRGAISLLVAERGEGKAVLERRMTPEFYLQMDRSSFIRRAGRLRLARMGRENVPNLIPIAG